jgi:hypothetical protein
VAAAGIGYAISTNKKANVKELETKQNPAEAGLVFKLLQITLQ